MTHSDSLNSFNALGSPGFRLASSPALTGDESKKPIDILMSKCNAHLRRQCIPDWDAQPANVRIRRPLSITFDEDEDGSTERPDTD